LSPPSKIDRLKTKNLPLETVNELLEVQHAIAVLVELAEECHSVLLE
jgi:hypothetical protein